MPENSNLIPKFGFNFNRNTTTTKAFNFNRNIHPNYTFPAEANHIIFPKTFINTNFKIRITRITWIHCCGCKGDMQNQMKLNESVSV